MKNIHELSTDKPSRLWTNNLRRRLELDEFPEPHPNQIAKHIYITSDEEIKEGDYCWDENKQKVKRYFQKREAYPSLIHRFKIILTTDQDLIKDGVQAIDDEFLEWFVKNPSCEEVEVKHKEVIQYGNMTMYDHNGDGSHYFCKDCEVETSRSKEELLKFGVEYYKIIIPKEEPKQETLEEAAERLVPEAGCELNNSEASYWQQGWIIGHIDGAKWQQERMYSEEEVKKIIKLSCEQGMLIQRTINDKVKIPYTRIKDFTIKMFEQFKKL